MRRVCICVWAYLLLSVGPARDLNNHVQDVLLLIGVERDIVERRDGDAILLVVDTVLQRVGLANLADGVGHGVLLVLRGIGDRSKVSRDEGGTS